MPYKTSMQQIYDSGDSPRTSTIALMLAGYAGAAERAAHEAKARGKLLGVGVATAVAATGGRDYEHAEIRFDPSGDVLITGSMDHGQGHGTTFSRYCRKSSASTPI